MRHATRLVGMLCAVIASFAVCVSTAAAAQRRVAVSSAVSMPNGSHVTGRLAADRRIDLAVGLVPRDTLALSAYAKAVSTPGSPDYGQTLGVRRFAQRFGAPAEHVEAVARELRRAGLTVKHIYANHLTIAASGATRTVERAFATHLDDLRLSDGRRTWIQTARPTLPADLAGDVASIAGLDGAETDQPLDTLPRTEPRGAEARAKATPEAQPHADPHATTPAPCSGATTAAAQQGSGTTSAWGYTANTIAAAYGFTSLFGAGDYGQGQTIDVFETESVDPADIAAYQSCYGTAATVNYVPVGTPDPIDSGADGDTESALDIEQLIGLAPQAAIDVYYGSPEQAGVDEDILSAMFSQDAAKTVSISYGSCEEDMDGDATQVDYEDTLFEEAAIQGQSVFAASGDSGSEECIPSDGTLGAAEVSASDYATQPLVTGVGGTTLYQGSGTTPAPWNGTGTPSEGVWNDGPTGANALGGGGGGPSSFWQMPSYQSGANPGLGVVNAQSSPTPCLSSTTDCRETPDVSADANPATGYVTYSNIDNPDAVADKLPDGWGVVGGTSASAPLWAALAADTDAQATCRGLTLGAANPLIYSVAGANYPGTFRDITTGDPFTNLTTTDVSGEGNGDWPVTAGYDMATGLGVPNVATLAPALCAARAPVYTVAIPNPGTIDAAVKKYFSRAVAPTDSGGAALTVSITGLPAGLTFLPQDDEIFGVPTTKGSSTITVSAADGDGNSASEAFTLNVVKGSASTGKSRGKGKSRKASPADLSRYSLKGVAKRHPKLTFTATRAKGQAKLRTITVTAPQGLAFGKKAKGIKAVVATKAKQGKKHRHAKAKHVKFTVKRHQQTLTIRFEKAETAVKVTIRKPALKVTREVAKKVRRGKTKRLKFTFGAVTTKKRSGHKAVEIRVKK